MDTHHYMEERGRNNYIAITIKNIDTHIKQQDYKKAFTLFLLSMEKLDQKERQELIDYYTLILVT